MVLRNWSLNPDLKDELKKTGLVVGGGGVKEGEDPGRRMSMCGAIQVNAL